MVYCVLPRAQFIPLTRLLKRNERLVSFQHIFFQTLGETESVFFPKHIRQTEKLETRSKWKIFINLDRRILKRKFQIANDVRELTQGLTLRVYPLTYELSSNIIIIYNRIMCH